MFYSISTGYWYVDHTDGLERPYSTFARALQAYLFDRDYSHDRLSVNNIWEA